MEIVNNGSSKKISGDTRNNWVTMMFVTHERYNCLKKQSQIDTCIRAFRELERFGFKFGEFGFAWNHVHFQVNIPKCYSVETAEIMLKYLGVQKEFLNSIQGFGSGIHVVVSGVDMNIMLQLV